MLDGLRDAAEIDLHLSADKIGQRGAATAIRYVHDLDASHHLEKLSSDMWRGAVARRCHIDLARIGLRICNEFRERFDRKRRGHHHNQAHAYEARNRRDIADEIEMELVLERGID